MPVSHHLSSLWIFIVRDSWIVESLLCLTQQNRWDVIVKSNIKNEDLRRDGRLLALKAEAGCFQLEPEPAYHRWLKYSSKECGVWRRAERISWILITDYSLTSSMEYHWDNVALTSEEDDATSYIQILIQNVRKEAFADGVLCGLGLWHLPLRGQACM